MNFQYSMRDVAMSDKLNGTTIGKEVLICDLMRGVVMKCSVYTGK